MKNIPKKVNNKTIRQGLRNKGISVFRTFPRIRTRLLAIKEQRVHWVFAEKYGFVALNIETLKLYNHGRTKNGLPKLRARDCNKMAIYRFPKKAFWLNKKK